MRAKHAIHMPDYMISINSTCLREAAMLGSVSNREAAFAVAEIARSLRSHAGCNPGRASAKPGGGVATRIGGPDFAALNPGYASAIFMIVARTAAATCSIGMSRMQR